MKRIPRAKNRRRPAAQKPKIDKSEDIRKLIHLLQINQIELEHQNQELRIAQEELEVSRNKYVNLFDFAPIPYFTLDMNNTIMEVNMNASRMFGVDRKKLIGKNLAAYIPLPEREIFHSFINAIFDSSITQSCEGSVLNKEKRAIRVRLEGVEVADSLDSDRKCLVALIELAK